ncbi:MAG TPA: hypothetical protein VKE69_13045 [Planctomycetota bacterium]|nr:hypothetical protein [Planctomycetota bacterium]
MEIDHDDEHGGLETADALSTTADEGSPHEPEPEEVTEAEPAPTAGKRARPAHASHGFAIALGILGVACAIASAAAQAGLLGELTERLAHMGLAPAHLLVASAGLVAMAWIRWSHETVVSEVRSSSQTIRPQADEISSTSAHADAVAAKITPAITSIVGVLDSVQQAVEKVCVQVEQIGEQFRDQNRASITLAGAVDGLSAKLERAQRETKAAPAPAPIEMPEISIADDLAPIQRLLDDLARDGHARSTKMLEAMRDLGTKLKDQMKPLETIPKGLEAQAAAIAKQGESLTKYWESLAKYGDSLQKHGESVARQERALTDRLDKGSASNEQTAAALLSAIERSQETTSQAIGELSRVLSARVEAAVKSADEARMAASRAAGAPRPEARPTPPPPAPLPAPDGEPDPNAPFAAPGPKESRTMLSAIDRLRRLQRGD